MLGGGRAGGGAGGDFDAESSPRRAPAPAPKAKATAGGEDFEDFPNALADEDDDLPF
jgi:single-strand DNA-binding protein